MGNWQGHWSVGKCCGCTRGSCPSCSGSTTPKKLQLVFSGFIGTNTCTDCPTVMNATFLITLGVSPAGGAADVTSFPECEGRIAVSSTVCGNTITLSASIGTVSVGGVLLTGVQAQMWSTAALPLNCPLTAWRASETFPIDCATVINNLNLPPDNGPYTGVECPGVSEVPQSCGPSVRTCHATAIYI